MRTTPRKCSQSWIGTCILLMCGGVAMLLAGCASSDVTASRDYTQGQRLPRPGRVIVYPIAAIPDDLQPNSSLRGRQARRSAPQTQEEIQLGRELGQMVAQDLVSEISDMGLAAQLAGAGPTPQEADVFLEGAFVSVDPGERAERILIGFDAGSGELKTHVEGFQITSGRSRPLGVLDVEAEGGKTPGLLVPFTVSAATQNSAGLVVGTALNTYKALDPESRKGVAKRTAKEIAEFLSAEFAKLGWITPQWSYGNPNRSIWWGSKVRVSGHTLRGAVNTALPVRVNHA